MLTQRLSAPSELPLLPPAAYRGLLETIDEAVLVVGHRGRVLEANPAAERLLRRLSPEAPATIVGSPLAEALPDALSETLVPPRGSVLAEIPVPTRAAGPLPEVAHTLVDVRGSGIDLTVRVNQLCDPQGRDAGWALVVREVTESNRQRAELNRVTTRVRDQARTIESLRADLTAQAIFDHLTGLYNRRHLISELAAAVQYATAARSELSLVVLDIDRFRNINGQYGVSVGDSVLTHIATMISGAILPGEVIARHGGQEFALMLPGVTAARAAAYVDALRQLIGTGEMLVQGHSVRATFSAGVAGFTGCEQPDDLLAAADAALYVAKQGGRNRVQLATTRPLEQPTATIPEASRRAAPVGLVPSPRLTASPPGGAPLPA